MWNRGVTFGSKERFHLILTKPSVLAIMLIIVLVSSNSDVHLFVVHFQINTFLI